MQIQYICHACLLIETGERTIVTDPWIAGPAYCGQWNVFPKPVNADTVDQADVVLISHGHEDHLHTQSLRGLTKDKRMFFPYLWYGGTKEFLRGLGYRDVVEATPGRRYRLGRSTSVTYITNELDSMIAIEANGKILLNLNDALHADPEGSRNSYLRILKNKYPQIDIVFCGFGGASYYPNTFHIPGRDNAEIGRLREQQFMHNFCQIIHNLKPRIAVPFAADFVFLSPDQRWMNSIRFNRSKLREYYRRHFGGAEADPVQIYDMYPGDRLENDILIAGSPYRKRMKNGHLRHLIDEQYPEEISSLKVDSYLQEDEAGALERAMKNNIGARSGLYSRALHRIRFCVKVLDVAERSSFNVEFNNRQPRVWRTSEPEPGSRLIVETTSRVLYCSFGSIWGGDAIGIGYGCRIRIRDRGTATSGLHRACIHLLTRHPKFGKYLKRHPVRGLRALLGNPGLHTRVTQRVWRSETRDAGSDRRWLLKSKDEIRYDLNLPLLDGN